MAFVGTGIVSALVLARSIIAIPSQYNSISIKGGQATFDKLRILNRQMSIAELDALSITDVYGWTSDVLLYAEFKNNLEAGSISLAAPVDYWNIVRIDVDDLSSVSIVTGLVTSNRQFYDYTAKKGHNYYYNIYPITVPSVVSYIQSNTVAVDYHSWIFIDDTTGDSFIFTLNLDSGNQPLNAPVTEYEGFGQYPTPLQSEIKYKTGQINCQLGYMDVNGNYVDTPEYFDALVDFITNGNTKIMKDKKGNIKRVYLKNLSENQDDKASIVPSTISFAWTEVGEN
jgi:hypothetical protein